MGLLRHCSRVLTAHHKPLRAIKRTRRATGSAQHVQQESRVGTMVHGMSLNRHPDISIRPLKGFEEDICMLSEMPLIGPFQGCPRAERTRPESGDCISETADSTVKPALQGPNSRPPPDDMSSCYFPTPGIHLPPVETERAPPHSPQGCTCPSNALVFSQEQ